MKVEQALARLQVISSKSEYCSGMIRKKMLNWSLANKKKGEAEFTNKEIDTIIELLKKDGYINDERFANAFVRDKARFQKWGEDKIIYNLKMLGIEAETIKNCLEENSDLFEDDILMEILNKKMLQLKETETIKTKREKLIRFGIGRGFNYSKVYRVVSKLLSCSE